MGQKDCHFYNTDRKKIYLKAKLSFWEVVVVAVICHVAFI